MMKTIILLAVHGSPPNDFPRHEMVELFGLKARLHHPPPEGRNPLELRHAELDAKMRSWPRTAENDPFYAGTQELAVHIRQSTGCDVIVGFNDFCAPGLAEAFDQSIAEGNRENHRHHANDDTWWRTRRSGHPDSYEVCTKAAP